MTRAVPSDGATAPAAEGRDLEVAPVSAETQARMERARDRYPRPMSAILPSLWAIQDQYGWLPPSGMAAVAGVLGLTPSEVQAVATFYSMYFQRPAGRHHVLVCVNAPCALRGSDDLCAYLERRLGVPSRGTTADGEFTWEATIECLGACGYAPMMQIDHHFHEFLTTSERVDTALDSVRGTPAHAAPATADRESAARLAATSGEPSGGSVASRRTRPTIVGDTGHSVEQASPAVDEVGPPPADVPEPSRAVDTRPGAAGLLVESEAQETPDEPAVTGASPGFTEQLAPGAVQGPAAAPRDPAEAAEQRAAERRRRRGRRGK